MADLYDATDLLIELYEEAGYTLAQAEDLSPTIAKALLCQSDLNRSSTGACAVFQGKWGV